MGSKGGGADSSSMIEYGNKALALQKEQYDYSKEVSQPWLKTGTSAINQLGTLMGLQGGGNESRQSIYDRLTPQYTTQAAAQPQSQGNWYVTEDGRMIDTSTLNSSGAVRDALNWQNPDSGMNEIRSKFIPQAVYGTEGASEAWKGLGLTPFQTQSAPTNTIDQAGLNAAADSAFANQTQADGFGSLLKNYTGQDLYTDPSYAYRLSQGTKAAERQLAASGKYLTPQASQALTDVGQQMGSQEYSNAYNRFNQDQGNLYNRLAGLAGMGQTQTGQVINAGSNYANAGTDLYTGMGNAITSANQANQANKGSMFNTLLSAAKTGGELYMMSDENLKRDIKLIGQENGHNVYEFAYKTDPAKKYIGVMAQEIAQSNPDAVAEINGYLAVDYDKIGVNFREVS